MTLTNSLLLKDMRILVTGAARGIGLALAAELQRHGARVALADIDGTACKVAALRVPGALALTMDVTDNASIERGLFQISQAFGGLDGLVNNAAVLDDNSTATISLDRFDQVLAVNTTSILRVTQLALPLLAMAGQTSIVNTLSTQSFFGQANSIAYSTAKGAALNLTRSMAVDFAPKGIRVNGVAPGFIDTRMAIMASGKHEHETDWFKSIYVSKRKIPLARAGTPEDCAGSYVFLLSNLSHYITGQVITVDGGLTATY